MQNLINDVKYMIQNVFTVDQCLKDHVRSELAA